MDDKKGIMMLYDSACANEISDGWMDGWIKRWMDGWVGGWMDGWMDE